MSWQPSTSRRWRKLSVGQRRHPRLISAGADILWHRTISTLVQYRHSSESRYSTCVSRILSEVFIFVKLALTSSGEIVSPPPSRDRLSPLSNVLLPSRIFFASCWSSVLVSSRLRFSSDRTLNTGYVYFLTLVKLTLRSSHGHRFQITDFTCICQEKIAIQDARAQVPILRCYLLNSLRILCSNIQSCWKYGEFH